MRLEDQEWVTSPYTGKKINMRQLIRDENIVMQQVTKEYPFFENLVRQLSIIYTFKTKTQATDGTRLLINPEFTESLSMKMKAFVLMHEVLHCALDHMARGRYHDHYKSNIAADYEVNCSLVDSGIVTPTEISNYIYDKKYTGWAYETIYADNPPGPSNSFDPDMSPQGDSEGQGGGGSSDKEIDNMSGQQAADNAQQSADRAQAAADQAKRSGDKKKAQDAQDAADRAQKAADEAKAAASAGDDEKAREKAKEARDAANEAAAQSQGSSSSNKRISSGTKQESIAASTPMGGFISQKAGAEIAEAEGYTGEDVKEESESRVSQIWREATIAACSQNNNPGLGSIVTKLRSLYLTSHDWKNELKKFIGRALSHMENDSKYGKRKWLANDEVKKMDKRSQNNLNDIIFLIDCSGSVSDDLLRRLVSECYTIVYKKGIEKVTYAYYDDGIREIETTERLRNADKLNLAAMSRLKKAASMPRAEVHGRGGNEESKVMDQLVELTGGHKVELVMWFTDGYTYKIPNRPKSIKNMIWVVYDNPDFKVSDDSRVIHLNSKDIGK